MNNRTKAFLTELSDLLKKYDTEIMVTEKTDSSGYGSYVTGIEFESEYTEPCVDALERVENVEIPLSAYAVNFADVKKKLD